MLYEELVTILTYTSVILLGKIIDSFRIYIYIILGEGFRFGYDILSSVLDLNNYNGSI
jgi:hypothetical protein